MANTKRYVITAITLGLICAASGALIGVTNAITAKRIDQNEKDNIQRGFAEIYGQNPVVSDPKPIEGKDYTNQVYTVEIEGVEGVQYAFRADGSNMYGKISMLVGFDSLNQFKGMSIIANTQTYASTLNQNYIDKIKTAENKSEKIEDVKCGATYGATLIRDMIHEAQEVAKQINPKE